MAPPFLSRYFFPWLDAHQLSHWLQSETKSKRPSIPAYHRPARLQAFSLVGTALALCTVSTAALAVNQGTKAADIGRMLHHSRIGQSSVSCTHVVAAAGYVQATENEKVYRPNGNQVCKSCTPFYLQLFHFSSLPKHVFTAELFPRRAARPHPIGASAPKVLVRSRWSLLFCQTISTLGEQRYRNGLVRKGKEA